MQFKDHFSKQSHAYQKYRPGYPKQLFNWIADICTKNNTVWDCGTGNGQAALALVEIFTEVVATDPSQKQIDHAAVHPRIQYKVASAETSGLPDNSCDLITVAQALHWFDFDRFYAEVRRVMKPDGIIIAWSYGLLHFKEPLQSAFLEIHNSLMKEFWPPERWYVVEDYQNIPFPFERITTPQLAMSCQWNFEDFKGYVETWSALPRFLEQHSRLELSNALQTVKEAWGDPQKHHHGEWQLNILAGRI